TSSATGRVTTTGRTALPGQTGRVTTTGPAPLHSRPGRTALQVAHHYRSRTTTGSDRPDSTTGRTALQGRSDGRLGQAERSTGPGCFSLLGQPDRPLAFNRTATRPQPDATIAQPTSTWKQRTKKARQLAGPSTSTLQSTRTT